jgi:hypothetical protein
MEYFVGLVVSLAVIGVAFIGFERDRAFYPTVLIVTASYYVLFAVMGGSSRTLLMELVFATVFSIFALVGFKRNLWLVPAAMVGHGVFDLLRRAFDRQPVLHNPGVPPWWPGFCLTFDFLVGGWMLVRLLQSRDVAQPRM